MAEVDRALWQKIIHQVVSRGGHIIRPWFTDLEPISLEHGLLEIRVGGPQEQAYCNRHAMQLFVEAAQAATGRLVGVCFLTAAEALQARLQAPEESPESVPTSQTPAAGPGTDGPGESPELSPEYTFSTFVTGPCNRLSHASCQAVSESPGLTYNPLFLHGNVGLGKTHLLHATCRRILEVKPDARICMLSCETFVNQFIESVSVGDMQEFRFRYRHADVLAIDDIQFLSDHEQIQEEFFHTFNTLYQTQKQIILSSDRGPAQIADLEERLVSRFNWGLVSRIDRPCYETRVAIVRKKARLRNIELPEDVACFIAGRIDTNIRELEGAIAKVAMLARVNDMPINLAVAEEALGTEPQPARREVTIEDILKAVTSRYQVRLSDLQSKKRTRSIALPRQICMYLARSLTNHSLEEIGGYFGGRDHTTVLHAKRTIESLREGDPQFQATLDLISRQLSSNV
jgi:chromosomal replication initiator protein